MSSHPAPIESDVTVRFVAPEGEAVLGATFSYTAADPYAVRLSFDVGTEEPVRWTFARELLRADAESLGDVKVTMTAADMLSIELSSPFGTARFEVPVREVAGFLARTYQAVPEGREYVDIDAELADLLSDGGAR